MKAGWRGAVGVLLSAALLWWTLKDTNLHDVWRVLSRSSLPLWIAATIAGTAIFPLRARRWSALLAPVAGRLPFRSLWQSTAVGMMVNNVVPARAGEFARAFALSRAEPQVKFTAAFASLAVDRLFDGVVVLLMMFVATMDPAFPKEQTIAGQPLTFYTRGAALFLLVVLIVLALLVAAPNKIFAIYHAIFDRAVPKHAPKGRALLEGFASGLGVLRSPQLMLEVLFWTTLHWLCNAFAFWLGFKAIGVAAPFSAGMLIQGLIAIGVAIPSTPGFFGPFEAAGKAGLALYGGTEAQAASWVIGFHLVSYLPITVLGGWYLSRLGLHFKDFSGAKSAGAGEAGGATTA
jgi:uncharacterized protein (TIRG00374 family)